ncbi:MAG: serine/threonine protein phosphatase [Clostridia bacterium]|nr:serine/threonine protein phosphatase [Clostridia bacterium]
MEKLGNNFKIFAISDLHLSINNPKPMSIFGPVWENYVEEIVADWKNKVKDDDIVLLAGDFSWAMKLSDAKKDIDFVATLPGKKIIIRGNHDYWWNGIGKIRSVLPKNFYALQNDCIKLNDYIFCGTRGWSFDDEKIINRELIRLEMSLINAKKLQINDEKIVCMIHFPPFEKNYSESVFTKLFEKYDVDCVVFGHLHGTQYKDYKMMQIKNGIKYYLTSCDLLKNKLIEIDC